MPRKRSSLRAVITGIAPQVANYSPSFTIRDAAWFALKAVAVVWLMPHVLDIVFCMWKHDY